MTDVVMVDHPTFGPIPQELADNISWPSAENQARNQRNERLRSEVDIIAGNILRWNELTDQEKAGWADYRQALLDVPQQEGFPTDVVWPTKP